MMWSLFFGHNESNDSDTTLQIPLTDSFKVEGDWLTKKREEIINKDKLGANRMLVNNPNRPVTLQKPTVLV